MKKYYYNSVASFAFVYDEDTILTINDEQVKASESQKYFEQYDSLEDVVKAHPDRVIYMSSKLFQLQQYDSYLCTFDGKSTFLLSADDVNFADDANLYVAVNVPEFRIALVDSESNNSHGPYWLVRYANDSFDVIYKSDKNKDWKIGEKVLLVKK